MLRLATSPATSIWKRLSKPAIVTETCLHTAKLVNAE